MRVVIDTSVLVAGIRSPLGASAEILRRVLRSELTMLASVPLFVEYEAVATRVEHLEAAGATRDDAVNLLDALAARTEPVEIGSSGDPSFAIPTTRWCSKQPRTGERTRSSHSI